MFLITKSGRRKAICTECRKLHAAKDCPKYSARKAELKKLDRYAAMVCAALDARKSG
jgi:hypothetical protein